MFFEQDKLFRTKPTQVCPQGKTPNKHTMQQQFISFNMEMTDFLMTVTCTITHTHTHTHAHAHAHTHTVTHNLL